MGYLRFVSQIHKKYFGCIEVVTEQLVYMRFKHYKIIVA